MGMSWRSILLCNLRRNHNHGRAGRKCNRVAEVRKMLRGDPAHPRKKLGDSKSVRSANANHQPSRQNPR
jgi:hypothetical protein